MEEEQVSLCLPQIPKDAYYEDYVASILNAGGYYLDRSIHWTEDGLDLLELDVVSTKFEDTINTTIIEIKSAGWGVKDVFKVNGWLNFLQLKKAAFIYQTDNNRQNIVNMENAAEKLNIKLIGNKIDEKRQLDDKAIRDYFDINLDNVPETALRAFRYSYNLDRVMREYLGEYIKSNPHYATPTKVQDYIRKINDTSFFISNPIKRLLYLSSLSNEYKKIAPILDHEINGEGIKDDDSNLLFVDYFKIFFPKEKSLTPVDVALQASLQNKVAVLKAMVEYIVLPKETPDNLFERMMAGLDFNCLQGNIRNGLSALETKPYFKKYPHFFQVFIYVFGGFILVDKKDDEYELLSKLTGIPTNNIDEVFAFWNELYNYGGEWFHLVNDYSKIFEMKFVPSPQRGVGVNFRRHYYAPEDMEDSDELFKNLQSLVSPMTYKDLIGWNNSAYYFLLMDSNLHIVKNTVDNKFSYRIDQVRKHIVSSGRYTDIRTIAEVTEVNHQKSNNHQGFVAFYNDNYFDVYIIKPDNKNENIPFVKVQKEIGINKNRLINFYVIGTDDSQSLETADNIWLITRYEKMKIEDLDSILIEIDKLRSK